MNCVDVIYERVLSTKSLLIREQEVSPSALRAKALRQIEYFTDKALLSRRVLNHGNNANRIYSNKKWDNLSLSQSGIVCVQKAVLGPIFLSTRFGESAQTLIGLDSGVVDTVPSVKDTTPLVYIVFASMVSDTGAKGILHLMPSGWGFATPSMTLAFAMTYSSKLRLQNNGIHQIIARKADDMINLEGTITPKYSFWRHTVLPGEHKHFVAYDPLMRIDPSE